MKEAAVSVATDVGKSLFVRIKREIDYLAHYKRNVENFKNEVEKSRHIRDHVRLWEDRATRRGEVLDPILQDRKRKFDSLETDARRLDEEVQENKRWFKGWCPDYISRYRSSKEAIKKIGDVIELRRDGNVSPVSFSPPPPGIEFVPDGDFEAFVSTKSAMKQVIDALKDEKVSIIGVFGMGGVGKTTLIKQVGKQLKEGNFYDVVVMATVSQNADPKKIQGDVAEELGMKLEGENVSVRARRLSQRVKQEKRILVILDDLWARLELQEVGIPYGDDHEGCKIVLITRSEDVCIVMKCQQKVRVEVLSEQDSWSLFKRNAGDAVDSDALRDTAWNVAKECKGLPIAIITLGRALIEKDPSYWEDCLQQLKSSSPLTIEGMDANVYKPLALSYNSLENEEIKSCFLFCCLFPEDRMIDPNLLMIYGMCNEFVTNVDTLEEGRRRVHTMLDKLKACCLLLAEGKFVRLHDVVRDVAISITSKCGHGFLVKAGKSSIDLKRESLEGHEKISLIDCGLTSLDDDEWPENPHLLTLLLQENEALKTISDNLFESMKSLLVLNLSRTGILSLPPSLPCLVNLRALCLDCCFQLTNISFIGGLKRLEILRLGNSRIYELTEEIGQLTNLRLLDLNGTRDLKRVAPNVMSKLSRLEELYMEDSFDEWEVEGMGDGSRASFAEVGSLSRLNHLSIDIKNVECLSIDIPGPWRNLKTFEVVVGGNQMENLFLLLNSFERIKFKRAMELYRIKKPISQWVQILMEKTEELSLNSCSMDNLRKLLFGPFPDAELRSPHEQTVLYQLRELQFSHQDDLKSIEFCSAPQNLQVLTLHCCSGLKILFSPVIAQSLKKLERLELLICDNVEKLISDEEELNGRNSSSQYPSSSTATFQNLRFLKIHSNQVIKSLFPLSLARGFLSLEELKISYCYSMEEIVSAEEGDVVDSGIFPRLKTLSLERISELARFYRGEVLLEWPSLEFIEVFHCPNLKSLPIGLQSAPKLQKIKVQERWFQQLEWKENEVKARLQSIIAEKGYVVSRL